MIELSSHSGIHTLKATQRLPVGLQTAWEFLSSPENLQKITPKHMEFVITSEHKEGSMYPGQIITYRVSPFKGYRTNWVTEITHVKENEYFVDEQRFGPYTFWHHKHFLKEVEGGVEMIDIVSYKVPMGWIGNLVNRILISKKVKQIFEYRFEILEEIFGTFNERHIDTSSELRKII